MQPQTMKKFLEITLGLNAHGDPQLLRIVLVNLPISRWATAIQSRPKLPLRRKPGAHLTVWTARSDSQLR